MGRNILETVMGAVVLIVAGGFLAFAYQNSGVKKVNGYPVIAKFGNVTGLALGSDVRMGGIKVGVVSDLSLNENYQAVVTLELKSDVKLPEDSTASVTGDGLLGSKFVALEPGAEEKTITSGGEIKFVQDSVSLEQLIGKFMFSGGGVEGKEESKEAPASDAAPVPTPAAEGAAPTIE